MILAMMITPLRMLFPKSDALRWLAARRRYLGVAAFVYAVFHAGLYIAEMGSLKAVLGEFFILGIWTGWIALFIFLPLALTSNDVSVRRLGPNWKKLQRLVYAAAMATLVHWIFVHNQIAPALVHFLPLAALEGYRIWRNFTRRHTALATSPTP
jgi:methionine sulfoxide reductase heme-binding subunit